MLDWWFHKLTETGWQSHSLFKELSPLQTILTAFLREHVIKFSNSPSMILLIRRKQDRSKNFMNKTKYLIWLVILVILSFPISFLLQDIYNLSIVDKLVNKVMCETLQCILLVKCRAFFMLQSFASVEVAARASRSVNPSTAQTDELHLQQKDSLCYKILWGCFVCRKHISFWHTVSISQQLCLYPITLRVVFCLQSPWWHL